jgi:DNA mismatch repair protein MutH
LAELAARAQALEGVALAELAARHAGCVAGGKGETGLLLEAALGAAAGSRGEPDFPELGVELKTLPIDASGRPLESTFVCTLNLRHAERLDWGASPVRAKLAHVLWVPVVHAPAGQRVGRPWFWRPSAAQEQVLRADFDDLVGMIAIGNIEAVTARLGRWLQLRPKAAHGAARVRAQGAEGEPLWAQPRGFYLRARFTGALLRHPQTLAGS